MRRGLDDLAEVLRQHDLAQYGWFETKPEALIEDCRTRAVRLLRPSTLASPLIDPHAALDLSARLAARQVPDTLGSMRYMRAQRRLIIGNVLQMLEEEDCGPISLATLRPGRWVYPPDELWNVNPRKLMQSFRDDLRRSERWGHGGAIFAMLHGEYAPEVGLYRLHIHALAIGAMIAVVDSLRGTRKYPKSPPQKGQKRSSPAVRMSRGDIKDLEYRLAYLLQSYWPRKTSGDFGEDGVRRREGGHPRIPEPMHSQHLLWLNRCGLRDIILTVGLSVNAQGRFVCKA